ncbi:MAG: zinc ribbon domain-containing protein [Clostridiales bacterium]|nr:zinc ribbon domain-containing protein [Clostridiales bacterium]
MLQAFTRNYRDNSTEAGFQFTFECDVCADGYKTSFIESETYKKKGLLRGLGQGASILGSLLGGRVSSIGYSASRATSVLSERFESRSPEWRKEHEQSFINAQNEAEEHFFRCPHCNKYVCSHCWNEDEGLCVKCAPRQEILVAKTRADAMKRNISDAGGSASVWKGDIESKTTICPQCGKPAGSGKFCNNCGASMELKTCPRCGAKNAVAVRFCNNCGNSLQEADSEAQCQSCGTRNPQGTRFCGNCGSKLD